MKLCLLCYVLVVLVMAFSELYLLCYVLVVLEMAFSETLLIALCVSSPGDGIQ